MDDNASGENAANARILLSRLSFCFSVGNGGPINQCQMISNINTPINHCLCWGDAGMVLCCCPVGIVLRPSPGTPEEGQGGGSCVARIRMRSAHQAYDGFDHLALVQRGKGLVD